MYIFYDRFGTKIAWQRWDGKTAFRLKLNKIILPHEPRILFFVTSHINVHLSKNSQRRSTNQYFDIFYKTYLLDIHIN